MLTHSKGLHLRLKDLTNDIFYRNTMFEKKQTNKQPRGVGSVT